MICVLAKSSPTLCNPMDCSLPGSPVHGILQPRILEWVAISFSRGSSWPGSNSHLLHWQAGYLSVSYRWSPQTWTWFCFPCVFICIVFKLHIRDIIQYHTSLFSALGCPKSSAMLWQGGGGNRASPHSWRDHSQETMNVASRWVLVTTEPGVQCMSRTLEGAEGTEGGLGLLWVPKAGLKGKED